MTSQLGSLLELQFVLLSSLTVIRVGSDQNRYELEWMRGIYPVKPVPWKRWQEEVQMP
jgi:hypothetical protein